VQYHGQGRKLQHASEDLAVSAQQAELLREHIAGAHPMAMK